MKKITLSRASLDELKLVRENSASAGQIILHGVGEHDRQPEETPNGREPNKPRAPTDVHEEQHDERHLGKGDQ